MTLRMEIHMKLYSSEIHFELLIVLEVHKVTSRPVVLIIMKK